MFATIFGTTFGTIFATTFATTFGTMIATTFATMLNTKQVKDLLLCLDVLRLIVPYGQGVIR